MEFGEPHFREISCQAMRDRYLKALRHQSGEYLVIQEHLLPGSMRRKRLIGCTPTAGGSRTISVAASKH